MKISEIKPVLNDKLRKGTIPSKILLDKFAVIEESSRKTSAYTDPKYAPFYYYLGSMFKPKNIVEIGFRLGFLSGSFLKGSKNVETFLAFQEKTDVFYSNRLGKSNIRQNYRGDFDFYCGKITDAEFEKKLFNYKWDMVIINEEVNYDIHRQYYDILWEHIALDGLIVSDYIISHKPAGKAFEDFCKIKNKEEIKFNTRYGVGVIQK
jgi:hypothetical protein